MQNQFKRLFKNSPYFLIFFGLVYLIYSLYPQANENEDSALPINLMREIKITNSTARKISSQSNPNKEILEEKPNAAGQRDPSEPLRLAKKNLASSKILPGTQWKIWKNTQTRKSEPNLSDEKLIIRLNHFDVSYDPTNSIHAFKEFDRDHPVVVYDERLNRAGLVMGLIKIETDDKTQLQKDLAALQAEITDSFEIINLYYVTGSITPFDLEDLYTSLKSRPYIKNIELSVESSSLKKK